MARSKNMQSLTNDVHAVYPGTTIYGIGDPEHQESPSDHNEDDTPGSKPAQSDADNKPEHRGIDVMIGTNFTKADAYDLINSVLADPAARARLYYIIFDGRIWSRDYGWANRPYSGKDKHTNHIHFSGHVSDDENDAIWPSVYNSNGGTMTTQYAEDAIRYTDNRVSALLQMQPNVKGTAEAPHGSDPSHSTNKLALAINTILTEVRALSTKLDDIASAEAIATALLPGLVDGVVAGLSEALPESNEVVIRNVVTDVFNATVLKVTTEAVSNV